MKNALVTSGVSSSTDNGTEKHASSLDFRGEAANLRINIEGMRYSESIIPMQIEKGAILIGSPDETKSGNNSMYVKKLIISGE